MFHCTVHLKGPSSTYKRDAVAVRHYVYSFGWYSDTNNKDQIGVQIFNTVSLRWRKLPPVTNRIGERPLEVPSYRWGHTAVLIGDFVYIWGGNGVSGISCNFLYGFDVNTHSWFRPKMYGTVPEARFFHSACALGNVIYIYGGRSIELTYNDDIHKLDTTTIVWTLINTVDSSARAWHSATIIKTKMFVLWGCDGKQKYNMMRVFDTESNCWLRAPSQHLFPEHRWGHSAFAYNGELYIFGGNNWKQDLNDLWKFNPETFSWKKIEPKGKSPYQMNCMCCCMVGDRIIIFGGFTGLKPHPPADDLFILDLSPSLKSLCKLAVIQYGLEQSGLPHNIMWELAKGSGDREETRALRKRKITPV